PELYALSLHDALPICLLAEAALRHGVDRIWDADAREQLARRLAFAAAHGLPARPLDDALLAEAIASIADGARFLSDLGKRSLVRSEEHTSELQSRENL